MKIKLSSILVAATIFFACDSSVPDSVRFENIVWNNPVHYRQTEYGYDENGYFSFTLEDSKDSFSVYLVDCDAECFDEDDIESLLNSFVEKFINNMQEEFSVKVHASPTMRIIQKDGMVVFRRYLKAKEEQLFMFKDILVIDNKVFIVNAVSTQSHMDNLKITAESVHIANDSDINCFEDNNVIIGIPNLSHNNVLEICSYIPDHELSPQARFYMTKPFYSVLAQAFRLASGDSLGAGEFLFYFVTGNGGSKPYYEVISVNRIDTDRAVATIGVRDLWGEEKRPSKESEQHIHTMSLVREGKRWLIDDFDNNKKQCELFVKCYL